MVRVGKFEKVVRLQSGHSTFSSVLAKAVEAIVDFSNEVARKY